jgi:hypothetical protein
MDLFRSVTRSRASGRQAGRVMPGCFYRLLIDQDSNHY